MSSNYPEEDEEEKSPTGDLTKDIIDETTNIYKDQFMTLWGVAKTST